MLTHIHTHTHTHTCYHPVALYSPFPYTTPTCIRSLEVRGCKHVCVCVCLCVCVRARAENIAMPAALLSRFDILWLMLDEVGCVTHTHAHTHMDDVLNIFIEAHRKD